ncbi:MAG: energy transducer TonB [Bacteriovorax sp.]|nr:energy transducer TonB [Bacteriovorax sp.]
MRTNKFIPFFLALSFHVIPFAYLLLKKPTPPTPVVGSFGGKTSTLKGIDLNAFSISQKYHAPTNSIKRVGLSAPSGEEEGSGNGNSKDSGSGSETLGNSTAPIFTSFKEPPYPPIARQKGYEGKVKIKAYYNQEGLITKVDIIESSGIKMLDETVKKTASDWKISSPSAGSFEKIFDFRLKN